MSDGYDRKPNVYSDSPNQGPKKSSGASVLLWVLGIGGGLLLLMCGGCFVGSYFLFKGVASNDPATVKETAQSITDIEPPSGYDPAFSMNMFGVKMAGFGAQAGESGHMLMLMAFPAGMGDEAQMKQQMKQSLQQQGGGRNNLRETALETRAYTIRGEECNVQIATVEDQDGVEFRQITAVFTAKNDSPAMLMLLMPEEEWADGGEEEFEKMIESMK